MRPSRTFWNSSASGTASSAGTPAAIAASTYSAAEQGTYTTVRPITSDSSFATSLNVSDRGPGELVDPAGVARLGQRGDGDVGHVLGVDERLGNRPGRQGDHPVEHGIEQEVLAEVLGEKLARSTVQSAPDAATTRSLTCAASSPRPDSSTSRSTPCATAAAENAAIVSVAPGNDRSGAKAMYAAAASSR